MKKRFLCLFLALVMLLSVALVGCEKKDDTEADVDTNTGAKTITMRIITEQDVFNTDEELEAFLKDVCGGDETDERYVEAARIKAAYDAVEAAFTKETKSNYKTNVEILFYTEDEYFEMLEVTMAEYALQQLEAGMAKRALEFYMDEYKATYPDQFPDSAIKDSFYRLFPEYEKFRDVEEQEGTVDDQYAVGDLGIQELVYPEAEKNQLDIVYIAGEEMYKEYIANKWILALDEYLGSTGAKLGDYITSTLLSGVKVDGQTFAIPNNVKMGEYTYMLIDKELADKYRYTYASFADITDCNYFLEDIKNSEPDSLLPIAASYKEVMDMFVWYWNIEVVDDYMLGYRYNINTENNFSVLGCLYGDPANTGRGKIELGFNNLLADQNYLDLMSTLKSYEYDGFFKAENDDREGAVISFTNGTYAIKKQAFYDEDGKEKMDSDPSYGVYTDENGKEYYVYVAKYPQAEYSALFGNMFAVSANTKNAEACMKVITLLNTNSYMKNLLQYGIEGVNYEINDDTGMLERLNRDYLMDTEKTGNCYISHPEEGLPADYWEDAKKQSNETLINPLLGFDFADRLADYGAQLDVDQLDVWANCNANTLAKLDACVTYEAFVSELDAISKSMDKELVLVDVQTYVKNPDDPEGPLVPGAIVQKYLRMDKMANKAYSTANGNAGENDMAGESPYTIYYKWLTEMKYLPDTVK